jgi:AcrR family transcriptional regulator
MLVQTEHEKQQERASRILDTAADLLLRWGYKRVTVEDIAERAGIGKGTLYLHWKTKDALFQTLLLREAVRIWRELLEGMRANATAVRLSRMMQAVMLITMRRPLARALFMGDMELLGKLGGHSVDRALRSQQMIMSKEFVVLLRTHGLLRTDLELAVQMYALQATITGFLLIEPFLADDDALALDLKASVLAQTIERAFEPEHLPPPAVMNDVANQLIAWIEQVCRQSEQQIDALSGLSKVGR